MANPQKVSAVVIAYNDEANIRACLESLEWADEIIVVDSFSTDQTKTICLTYPTVKFSENPFHGHVQQKNHAIGLCAGEWILSMTRTAGIVC